MEYSSVRKIAIRRVGFLFQQAKRVVKFNPALSTRYISLAKQIAMAAKIRLPIEFRRQTCKKCNTLFVHGSNCRVRVKQKREPHIVITCLNCGSQTRIMLKIKVQNKLEQNNNSHETTC